MQHGKSYLVGSLLLLTAAGCATPQNGGTRAAQAPPPATAGPADDTRGPTSDTDPRIAEWSRRTERRPDDADAWTGLAN